MCHKIQLIIIIYDTPSAANGGCISYVFFLVYYGSEAHFFTQFFEKSISSGIFHMLVQVNCILKRKERG